MKQKTRIFITMVLCLCLLWGGNAPVKAAQNGLTALTFDADYYYNAYPDLQAALGHDYNTLYNHYLNFGLAEGRSGSAEFNCLVYRNNYPDLQAAYGDDYRAYCIHYENYGKAEGRSAAGDGMALTTSSEAPASTLLGTYSTTYNPDISTERHPHSLSVGYIPDGMDATISGNALDLQFTNIFDTPIQIQATADQGTLTVSIYKL